MSNRVDVIVNKAKPGGPTKRTVGSKNREIFSMLCESLVISVLSGGQGETKRDFVRENV